MLIDKSFHVGAPPDAVWALVKDVPRVLPHIPGAQLLQSASDRAHSAGITLRGGPMKGTYAVSADVRSVDDQSRTVVVLLTAEDAAGRGGVTATVTASVAPSLGGCQIVVHADIQGTGEAAALEQHLPQGAAPGAANEFVANIERTLQRGA